MSPYKCQACGNDRSFVEVKGKKRYRVYYFGRNKKGAFECMPDSDYPENFEPDYIVCAKCDIPVE